jgi:hypothetical protein
VGFDQLDDGWAVEEPATTDGDLVPATAVLEPSARARIGEHELAPAPDVDDGWALDELPIRQRRDASPPRSTIVRTPGRLTIYPRSAFTPSQAYRAGRDARWRQLWTWAAR